MDKLSKSEIKILKLLDKHVGAPSDKEETIKFLRNTLAFNHHQSIDYYKLWYLNKEDIIPYEEMEDIDRGSTFLIRMLWRIINSETSPSQEIDDIQDEQNENEYNNDYDKLMGSWWYLNCNRYSGKLPCMEWEKDGIVLNLDQDQWGEFFSGLNEEGMWVYRNATSYYSDDTEDFSHEEFDYAIYNDEIIDKFKQLSEISGLDDYPGRGGVISEEEISKFLMSILTSDEYESVVDDYLAELGNAVSRGRNKSVVDGYDEEVNYPTISCDGGGDYCIKIPYEDLLELVKDNNLISFTELKDLEINGEILIEDYYHDGWYDDEGRDDVLEGFNNILQGVIDDIEESYGTDLGSRMEKLKNFYLYLKKLGLEKTPYLWKSKDGRIIVRGEDYNPENNTIKFSYNGENHNVPLEELVNWVQGSILDLNESIRMEKYRLENL